MYVDTDFDNLLAEITDPELLGSTAWPDDSFRLTAPASLLLHAQQRAPAPVTDSYAWQLNPVENQIGSLPSLTSLHSDEVGDSAQRPLAPSFNAPVSSTTNAKPNKKRTKAWTLKNRRAQARFKAKQKASLLCEAWTTEGLILIAMPSLQDNKAHMHQQLLELSKHLEALETKHTQLMGRNAALEATLAAEIWQLEILNAPGLLSVSPVALPHARLSPGQLCSSCCA